ncbi:hypothetical protein KBC79_05085, partial [Candidatus Woesebacteria bacterium]|nr:hypothetical protein [Candidatus Woesebacteria bacterium]
SYVFTHHHYPGGGDLQAAQAVQYKLQQSSTPDTYIQNLDASEYLECYSANTLFCALVRKLGVPARLVVGHRVSGARKGVSEIDSTTGHAWSEIWDGTQWVRFDATPAAKPEDKQKKQEKDQQEDQSQDDSEQESAPDADDGPADQSPPPQQGSQDNQQNQQQQSQSQDQQSQQQSQDQQQQQNQQQQDSQSMGEASEQSIDEAKQQLDAAKEKFEEMKQQKQELKDKVEQADSFKDIEEIKKELDQAGLLDQMEKDLERQIEAKQEQMKQEMEDKLDKLADDGFLDEKKRDELLDKLKDGDARELDRLEQEVRKEQQLADTYEGYTQLVEPAVEYWWERFVNSLPRQPEMDFDEDALMRQGAFNRRAVQNPRNLIFGTVRNPRLFSEQVKPMFMATVMIDVSGSMSGEKLQQALLLLVFYNQLFSRISKEYGYIRYANYVFSDSLRVIKDFDQDYESSDRYEFYDGKDISGRERKSRTTIKARIMNAVKADGGTNMLGAVEHVATQLNAQKQEFPDYTSAFYFMGDGEDTCGNSGRVRQFLQAKDADPGFGDHLVSAIVLGGQLEFQQLSAIFGPESTAVARTFDELVEKAMENFERDITNYVSSLTRAF